MTKRIRNLVYLICIISGLFLAFTVTSFGAVYSVTVNESGDKTGTVSVYRQNTTLNGYLDVSVAGIGTTGTCTVSLERTLNDNDWYEVVEYSVDTERVRVDKCPNAKYRLKCNDYTSGTVTGRLADGE